VAAKKDRKQYQMKTARASAESAAATPFSAGPFLGRHSVAIAVGLILVASVRIGLTYTIFNHTSDEPNHIASGMEFLQFGTYAFDTSHPPLARVAAALGPYLIGARISAKVEPGTLDVPVEGARILSRNHRYDLTLALARLGILPFFWIACWVVFWWARRYYGAPAGLMAVFLFSFLPAILAHGGLATTDMALTAFVGAAFVSAMVWMEEPTPRRGVLFGACCGLAVLSKSSSLPFLPAFLGCTLILYLLFERPGMKALPRAAQRALPSFVWAALVAVLVVWAGFRFSFGRASPAGIPVPAPELFRGILDAMEHNRSGHHTYLLGQYSTKGFWYYYPVVLGVKTPLAFLLLSGCGLYQAVRKPTRPSQIWQPLGLIAGVLAVGLYSRINIGVRHILPIYMGMSVLAALAALRLPALFATRLWGRAALGVLLMWFAGSSLLAHPDYLPYFNELAGSQPEKIVVDSDLDWGQDLKRLAHRLQEVGADRVSFFSTLVASFQGEFGLPPMTMQDPFKPAPGWNAVSMTHWKLGRMGLITTTPEGKWANAFPDRPLWPETVQRGELVGKSILLWNVIPTPPPAP
jgi:hypothetical protein